MRACLALLLLASACGRAPEPPSDEPAEPADPAVAPSAPTPVADPAADPTPTHPTHAHDHDDDGPLADEHTHDHPVDPPVPVDPALPPWTTADAPDVVIDDRRSSEWLEDLATGLADHLDPARGVLWDPDGAPRWLSAAALAELDAPLRKALARAGGTARCRSGVCLLTDGATRWFLRVRRHRERGRILAGVLRANGWPSTARYHAWLDTARDAWQLPTFELLGQGLSAEENGKYPEALAAFARMAELDPDNPWPLYYTARVQAARREFESAFIALRLLVDHPSPISVNAQLRLDREHEFVRFRTHSAVAAAQRELRLPPPSDVADFLEHLRRFRAAAARLGELIADGGPDPVEIGRLLEARLLDEPRVSEDPPAVAWRGAALTLARDEAGALQVVGVTDEAP